MSLTIGADSIPVAVDKIQDINFPTISATQTLTPGTHRRVQVDATSADVTAILPDAVTSDKISFLIMRSVTDANEVVVQRGGSDTINGRVDFNLTSVYEWVEVVSDGTNNWKIINKGDQNNAPDRVVIVNELADFPTAVSGTITLETGLIYHIFNNIDIGTDNIDTNGAIMIGENNTLSGITYSGVLACINSTDVNVICNDLFFTCTDSAATVFNLTDDGTHNASFYNVVSSQNANLAVFDNFQFLSLVRCGFFNSTIKGIVLTGSFDIIAIRNSAFGNNAGIFLDFSGATAIGVVNLATANFNTPSGATAVKNVADSANITDYFRMIFCDFLGLGTYVDTMTRCDPPVEFFGNIGNSGTENSTAKTACYVADGSEVETVISTIDVVTPLLGTYTLSDTCKFDSPSNGVLRYLGSQTLTADIVAKFLVTPASGSNKTYWLYINYYHWNGSGYDAVAQDLLSRDEVKADSGSPSKAVIISEIVLHTNDKIEIGVANKTDTTNLTGSAISMIVSS